MDLSHFCIVSNSLSHSTVASSMSSVIISQPGSLSSNPVMAYSTPSAAMAAAFSSFVRVKGASAKQTVYLVQYNTPPLHN